MKLSWNYFKISIAGAKLSHLVQEDKIWDHGSMTEQVKNIFYQVEKAKNRKEPEFVRKYVTPNALEQIVLLIAKMEADKSLSKNTVLTQVSIIDVSLRTTTRPDRFTAFIKGKRKAEENETAQILKSNKQSFGIENFSQRWHFIRQGEWWLLDSFSQ
jgi:hypothetical protein